MADKDFKEKWQGDVRKDFQKGFQKAAKPPEALKSAAKYGMSAIKRLTDLIPSAGASDYSKDKK